MKVKSSPSKKQTENVKIMKLYLSSAIILLLCAICNLASAKDLEHKEHPRPVKKSPVVKPVKAPEKHREKKPQHVETEDLHRRHHRKHLLVTFIVYTRPAVVLVGPVWTRIPGLQAEAQTLRDAYIALSRANADYDNHRFGAMRQVAMAGDLLGIYLRGDGSGDEPQDASDAQLDLAQDLLKHAESSLLAKGYPEVAGHVDQAIQEINAGLDAI